MMASTEEETPTSDDPATETAEVVDVGGVGDVATVEVDGGEGSALAVPGQTVNDGESVLLAAEDEYAAENQKEEESGNRDTVDTALSGAGDELDAIADEEDTTELAATTKQEEEVGFKAETAVEVETKAEDDQQEVLETFADEAVAAWNEGAQAVQSLGDDHAGGGSIHNVEEDVGENKGDGGGEEEEGILQEEQDSREADEEGGGVPEGSGGTLEELSNEDELQVKTQETADTKERGIAEDTAADEARVNNELVDTTSSIAAVEEHQVTVDRTEEQEADNEVVEGPSLPPPPPIEEDEGKNDGKKKKKKKKKKRKKKKDKEIDKGQEDEAISVDANKLIAEGEKELTQEGGVEHKNEEEERKKNTRGKRKKEKAKKLENVVEKEEDAAEAAIAEDTADEVAADEDIIANFPSPKANMLANGEAAEVAKPKGRLTMMVNATYTAQELEEGPPGIRVSDKQQDRKKPGGRAEDQLNSVVSIDITNDDLAVMGNFDDGGEHEVYRPGSRPTSSGTMYQDMAAQTIQSAWKGYRSRMLFATMQKAVGRVTAVKRQYKAIVDKMKETVRSERQERKAVESVLHFERKKVARLQAALNDANRKLKARTAVKSMSKFNEKDEAHADEELMTSGGEVVVGPALFSNRRIPFEVHAEHKARKEVEAAFGVTYAECRRQKLLVRSLLRRLKGTQEAEEKRKEEEKKRHQEELMWRERNHQLEIEKLTKLIETLGQDPDLSPSHKAVQQLHRAKTKSQLTSSRRKARGAGKAGVRGKRKMSEASATIMGQVMGDFDFSAADTLLQNPPRPAALSRARSHEIEAEALGMPKGRAGKELQELVSTSVGAGSSPAMHGTGGGMELRASASLGNLKRNYGGSDVEDGHAGAYGSSGGRRLSIMKRLDQYSREIDHKLGTPKGAGHGFSPAAGQRRRREGSGARQMTRQDSVGSFFGSEMGTPRTANSAMTRSIKPIRNRKGALRTRRSRQQYGQ